jgi:Pentapeptide repeats (8 copies)
MEQLNESTVAQELFNTLNALKPNEVTKYIHTFCHPDSECYKEIERMRLEQPIAYVCSMLITPNINQFSTEGMEMACEHLQKEYPTSSFNESLAWIYTLSISSQNKIIFGQTLKSIQNVPCYMNYSGLDFGILQVVEKINFSNTNCRATNFDGVEINDCDFYNANLSSAYFRIRGGKGCNFNNALFNKTQFIESLDADLNNLTSLHTLLATSKGRDTIKASIVDNIIDKLATIHDTMLKKTIVEKLKAHPLLSEHRNNLFGGLNKVLSVNSNGNIIQTNGQKTLSVHYPERQNTKSTWVNYTTDNKGSTFLGYSEEYEYIDDSTLEVTNQNNEDTIFDLKDLETKEDSGWGCRQQ